MLDVDVVYYVFVSAKEPILKDVIILLTYLQFKNSKWVTKCIILLLFVHSYRKIPGDKCEGGQTPERKEINLRQRCVSDLLSPEPLVSTCAYQVFTFCNFLQFLSHFPSAVVLTGKETPLQICTHCGNSHYCHATECRRRSSLCQEICLWWQVRVFFNTHATKMYLLQACGIYRVIHNHL